MSNTFINKVAVSGLINLNLEDYFPKQPFVDLDLAQYLFQGLILREKDFRDAMNNYDWSSIDGHILLVSCSADAIIPSWAYMLIASHATGHAFDNFLGNKESYLTSYYREIIQQLPIDEFIDQRIVIKGCSKKPVPVSAYLEITKKLQPVSKSIMFGEPCSTVPIYKRK